MKHARIGVACLAKPAAFILALSVVSIASAQTGSLYGNPERRRPLTLAQADWTYISTPERRELKLHDLVTVLVDEKSQVISEGEMDRKKQTSLEAALKDWVIFSPFSLGIKPDPQSNGEPKIDGHWNNKFKSQADFETRDAMKFNMTARIVDIRPNGTLVIEGRRTIKNNYDTWEFSLTGVIRAEDVQPNNTVMSEKVAEMTIFKREAGHVRDGYRRGWLMQWLDQYQPF
jgi:flagellar L-ring protein precursor FlgH